MEYVATLYTPEKWKYIKEYLSSHDVDIVSTEWGKYKYIVYLRRSNILTNWDSISKGRYSSIVDSEKEFIESILKLKNFTKDDLKPGFILETGNGNRYLYFGIDKVIGESGYLKLSSYENDLTHKSTIFNNEWDIYKILNPGSLTNGFNSMIKNAKEVIWRREKTYEFTIFEIAEKLNLSEDQITITGFPTIKQKFFPKSSLIPGMIVEVYNGLSSLAMITGGSGGNLCLSGPSVYFFVNSLDNELTYGGYSITKVFGCTCNKDAYKIDTKDRELLWKRKPVYSYTQDTIKTILSKKLNIPKNLIVLKQ